MAHWVPLTRRWYGHSQMGVRRVDAQAAGDRLIKDIKKGGAGSKIAFLS